MKILLLTHEFPPFPGGVGTYSAELARAAAMLGHDVTVVAPDFGSRELGVEWDMDGVRLRRFRGGTYSIRQLLPMLLRAALLPRTATYDVVHAADWPFAMALAFINRFAQLPFVATVYGTELLGVRQGRQVQWLGVGGMFEAAERVFAISEFTRSLLLSTYPNLDGGRVCTTLLGVHPFWFEPVNDTADLRQRLGIGGGQKVILTAGRLDERKGHKTVLEALALLPSAIKAQVSYVIAGREGDASYMNTLRSLAGASAVEVVFAGAVSKEDLRRLYALASVFCMPGEPHPKKVEGFGLVYLEAAAQGLPGVASDFAAMPEVVKHERTGILVPPLDARALAVRLEELISDQAKAENLGRAASRWAEGFTWAACAERTYGRSGTQDDADEQRPQRSRLTAEPTFVP